MRLTLLLVLTLAAAAGSEDQDLRAIQAAFQKQDTALDWFHVLDKKSIGAADSVMLVEAAPTELRPGASVRTPVYPKTRIGLFVVSGAANSVRLVLDDTPLGSEMPRPRLEVEGANIAYLHFHSAYGFYRGSVKYLFNPAKHAPATKIRYGALALLSVTREGDQLRYQAAFPASAAEASDLPPGWQARYPVVTIDPHGGGLPPAFRITDTTAPPASPPKEPTPLSIAGQAVLVVHASVDQAPYAAGVQLGSSRQTGFHKAPIPDHTLYSQKRPGTQWLGDIFNDIGPYAADGSTIWFANTFYDGEGLSGVGAIGSFDVATGRYQMRYLSEIAPWSGSALLVDGRDVWVGLMRRPEGAEYGGGLLRYNMDTGAVTTYPVPDLIYTLDRVGDTLYCGTADGLYTVRGGQLTQLRFEPDERGKLGMVAHDVTRSVAREAAAAIPAQSASQSAAPRSARPVSSAHNAAGSEDQDLRAIQAAFQKQDAALDWFHVLDKKPIGAAGSVMLVEAAPSELRPGASVRTPVYPKERIGLFVVSGAANNVRLVLDDYALGREMPRPALEVEGASTAYLHFYSAYGFYRGSIKYLFDVKDRRPPRNFRYGELALTSVSREGERLVYQASFPSAAAHLGDLPQGWTAHYSTIAIEPAAGDAPPSYHIADTQPHEDIPTPAPAPVGLSDGESILVIHTATADQVPFHAAGIEQTSNAGRKMFRALPVPTADQYAKARPTAKTPEQIESDIGPYAADGTKFWFATTFYDGEGDSGVGGIGSFDAITHSYEMRYPPEIAPWSSSTMLINGRDLWVGLMRRPEGANYGGGLLRYNMDTGAVTTYPVRDLIYTLDRVGDTLYCGTSDGLYTVRGGQVTHLRFEPDERGKLSMIVRAVH